MTHIIEAPASVTMRDAKDFAARMLDFCEPGEDRELRCENLAEVDLSFLQVLHAARAHLAATGATLRLSAPAPAPVVALLERAGFLTDPAPADLEFWFQGDLPR